MVELTLFFSILPFSPPTALVPRLQPQEIKDIKTFLNIARREDAKCTSPSRPLRKTKADYGIFINYISCRDQEIRLPKGHCQRNGYFDQVQVQSTMLQVPLHLCYRRCRQG
jgi:hypothetical protein